MDAKAQIVEQIAKICHQANKAYCENLGDFTQVNWQDAPDWQKKSARAGVTLHLDTDASPAASHESWMKEKLADGWKFGDHKDVEKKLHPCLVPYDKLPRLQKNKDILFTNIVRAFKGQEGLTK